MIFHQPGNSIGNHAYNAFIYSQGMDWESHFHQNLELIYVFSGRVDFNISGKKYTLLPDDFALCLSNEIHSLHFEQGAVCWVGVFSEDFVPEFVTAVDGRVGEDCRFHCDETTLHYLKQNLLKEGTPDFYSLSSCLYAVCGVYLRQVRLLERHCGQYSMMNFILDYVSKNYQNKITLKDMADAMGYDYFYFSKLFYAAFGMHFNDYLNTYRFNASIHPLLKSDCSITEIALKSGFQSIRTFNDVFRRKAGVSPAEYRKIARGRTDAGLSALREEMEGSDWETKQK